MKHDKITQDIRKKYAHYRKQIRLKDKKRAELQKTRKAGNCWQSSRGGCKR